MALKFIDDVDNCGMDDQAIEAIDYAANKRRRTLINASWGGHRANPVLDPDDHRSEAAVRRRRPATPASTLDAPRRRDILSRRVERERTS